MDADMDAPRAGSRAAESRLFFFRDHLLAGAAAEIHPRALEKALGLRSLELELDRATAEAISLGVATVPSVRIRRRIFVGDGRLEDAAEAAR